MHIIGMVIAQMKRRMIKMNISSQICSSKGNTEFPWNKMNFYFMLMKGKRCIIDSK